MTTNLTSNDQSRGRLAMIAGARSHSQLVLAYAHLRQHAVNYSKTPVIGFDAAAAAKAAILQKSKLRLGTMDIRIAAIALSNDALLISRNIRDFRRVPNLRVKDWSRI